MNEKVSVNTEIPSPYIEKNGGLYRMKRKLTYAFAFRLLRKHLNKQQELQVLEIGTGSGFFLDFAQEQFPNARFSGVEYDERLMAETASRAPHANLIQGNAENFDLGRGQYDLVVSFQVIEHLYNPVAMLENVLTHLKPGGIFLVTTPNLSGLGARWMKNNWHGYRDDHVSLKGKAEWDRLIMAHGFSPLYSGSTFFSGVPLLNKLPLGIVNWLLLVAFGSLRWSVGESYVGVFKSKH
jgi:2-polyprenyl-3-methyl-5-hydroxy-6-metoxy-1,4-benzoquinol methylase